MTWHVQPRLVNDTFGDPGLYLDFRHARRAILFDLGDLAVLSPRELLRVSHAFVSHAHMDHFSGFDRLLRVCLHRPAPLRLVGPPGFSDRVRHRLDAYTWNLLDADSVDFAVLVREFDGVRLGPAALFRARHAFRCVETPAETLPDGVVLDEDGFQVEAALIDHGTPCLALAFRERQRINVWRQGLERLGLPVGPWLNEAKHALRRGAPDDSLVQVSEQVSITLGALREHALRVAPGQAIAYVVDAAFTPANAERIIALARCVDRLFIEAVFLQEDETLATERRHLTAAQAGRLARAAGARQIVPLHFSPRYADRPEALAREAEAAFAGRIG